MDALKPVSAQVHVGVDVGQRQDPTAIVVAEVEKRGCTPTRDGHLEGGEYHYVIRHAERLALGTSYPAVVRRLAEINRKLQAQKHSPCFWVDATGVGQPVIDLLDAAGLLVVSVYLTGGDKAAQEGRELRLGKALLVSRLQVLLQAGRIHLPSSPEARVLVDELLNYEIRVNEDAHAQFGAFKMGTHDDLATALGLACWHEPYEFLLAWA